LRFQCFRFYNNNSSFVHGGLDAPNRETKPVVGQKQIHQKIQQLNFRDCHAKISQVDSQATLGDGVVVQVKFVWFPCVILWREMCNLNFVFTNSLFILGYRRIIK
jgi:hypothetical protein